MCCMEKDVAMVNRKHLCGTELIIKESIVYINEYEEGMNYEKKDDKDK